MSETTPRSEVEQKWTERLCLIAYHTCGVCYRMKEPCNAHRGFEQEVIDTLHAISEATRYDQARRDAAIAEHHVNWKGPLRQQIATAIRHAGGVES